MSKLKVFYILLVTLAGIFFLYRESINIYWAQTYHRESPLVAVENGVENWIDSTLGDRTFFKINEADYQTEIVSQDGLKGVDRIVNAENYQRHLAASGLEAISANNGMKSQDSLIDDGISSTQVGKYSHFSSDFAGPILPQLPSELVVTAGDKLFFVGDSLMQGVAPRVKQSLYKSENIDGIDLSKQSTGLAYPKFYNWPEVVAETLQQDDAIKAVIVYMGANDPWDFPVPGRKQYLRFKSADWERAYRERVRTIILSAHEHQLPLIWLGAPCMRKEKLHQDMVYLNTIYQSEMEKFNGTYFPTSDLLGCSDTEYRAYIETDEGDRKVRTGDGIHFTPTGQRRIAERIIAAFTIQKEAVLEVETLGEAKADSIVPVSQTVNEAIVVPQLILESASDSE